MSRVSPHHHPLTSHSNCLITLSSRDHPVVKTFSNLLNSTHHPFAGAPIPTKDTMAPHAEADSGSLHGDGQSNGHQAAVAATATRELFTVNSSNVTYTDNEILSKYTYRTTDVAKDESGKFVVTPVETVYEFKTERKVPKTGMMLVGLGGNNGTTVTAGIIANRRGLTWQTREGVRAANYYGSEGRQHSLLGHPAHGPPQRPRHWRLGH
ncbi:Inositol-3-phosphate synthase like protein [Verticillium longisporum]|uniref:Inositol-3-phosphate synthase like protein n=1 Tax=Verticillium longisporum TaxID=100787 RepID=A0A8I2Z9J3_VERLO|nr:Inositol-3-phosphate synthase like protein [Verticillium longisporum]